MNVTLQPSGAVLKLEPGERILDGARRPRGGRFGRARIGFFRGKKRRSGFRIHPRVAVC